MNELWAIKHDELLTEFNRYVLTHPEFLQHIPDQAVIVLLDPEDHEFNRYNLARVQNARRNDDLPQRAVVYVDVGELAPVQSRLLNPRVLRRPADALALAG